MKFKTLYTFIITLFVISTISKVSSEEIKGFANIIDGDTIKISKIKIRLSGIDAPELKQFCIKKDTKWPCGLESKKALIEYTKNNIISCTSNKKDRYNRLVAKCYKEKQDIQKWLVKNGWAIAYRKYSLEYINDENFAQNNNLGIWKGKFIKPYKWRKINKNK